MQKLFTLITVCFLVSCSPKPIFYPLDFNNKVAVGTPGVKITAMDESFEWEYGNNYNLPSGITGAEWASTGGPLNISTSEIKDVKEDRAIKVMVETPYRQKPLYGLLQISRIISECKGNEPATRAYYIQVPEHYVQAAEGGKVSVVYESYMCQAGYYKNRGAGPVTELSGHSTWVLWLSDIPL